MARVDVPLHDVLLAIVARLRNALGMNEGNCFLSMDPENVPPSAGETMILVGLDGGNFDGTEGGGQFQLMADTAVEIGIYSAILTDQRGRDQETLTNETRGIIALMGQVLEALTNHDLEVNGDTCLRQTLTPQGFHRPKKFNDRIASTVLVFGVSFDWDIVQ